MGESRGSILKMQSNYKDTGEYYIPGDSKRYPGILGIIS